MKQSLVGCRAPGGPIQTNLKALRCFLSAARAAQDLGWRRRNVGMPAWLPSIGELEARATEAEDDTDKVNNDVPARGGVNGSDFIRVARFTAQTPYALPHLKSRLY